MNKHLVLIEDEPAIRANYRAAFERRGYRVTAHGDRASAWQVLRQSLPDLAIIDVGLKVEGRVAVLRGDDPGARVDGPSGLLDDDPGVPVLSGLVGGEQAGLEVDAVGAVGLLDLHREVRGPEDGQAALVGGVVSTVVLVGAGRGVHDRLDLAAAGRVVGVDRGGAGGRAARVHRPDAHHVLGGEDLDGLTGAGHGLGEGGGGEEGGEQGDDGDDGEADHGALLGGSAVAEVGTREQRTEQGRHGQTLLVKSVSALGVPDQHDREKFYSRVSSRFQISPKPGIQDCPNTLVIRQRCRCEVFYMTSKHSAADHSKGLSVNLCRERWVVKEQVIQKFSNHAAHLIK